MENTGKKIENLKDCKSLDEAMEWLRVNEPKLYSLHKEPSWDFRVDVTHDHSSWKKAKPLIDVDINEYSAYFNKRKEINKYE